ncbi:hypothetical protein JN531_016865 (plasmid) [Flagellatimonas centrodinii]|uniref:hypothetical protein n=1 Tax=Flagellatimonas centrodinii TaxID=2806210 RepID=UPI001FFB9075|nr:hypothetical protein [Flagellatimonas centrodinii]ULQ48450.1 hypothetical protein JN531_016865 [Flagellatimonas centrodinii]
MKQLSFAALMVAAMMPAAAYAERAAIDPSVMRGSILSGSDSTGDELPDATYDPGAGGGFINPEDNDGGGGGQTSMTVDLAADAARYTVNYDSPARVTWTSTGAASCSNPGQSLFNGNSLNGNRILGAAAGERSYTFTCFDPAGVSRSDTVTVTGVLPPSTRVEFIGGGVVRSTVSVFSSIVTNPNFPPIARRNTPYTYRVVDGEGFLCRASGAGVSSEWSGVTNQFQYSQIPSSGTVVPAQTPVPGTNQTIACGRFTERSPSTIVEKGFIPAHMRVIDRLGFPSPGASIDTPYVTFEAPRYARPNTCSVSFNGQPAAFQYIPVTLDGSETMDGISGSMVELLEGQVVAPHVSSSIGERNYSIDATCTDVFGDSSTISSSVRIRNQAPQLAIDNSAADRLYLLANGIANYRSVDGISARMPSGQANQSRCSLSVNGVAQFTDRANGGFGAFLDNDMIAGGSITNQRVQAWSVPKNQLPTGPVSVQASCTDIDGTHTLSTSVSL